MAVPPKELTEAFTNLEKTMKTDVNSLVQWLKDSKLIGDSKEEMDKAVALFSSVADSKKVKLDEFIGIVGQISANLSKPLEDMAKLLMQTKILCHNCAMAVPSKELTEAFTNLEKTMKTDVNSLVQWLKDSKLIGDSKEEMDKAVALFSSVADSKKVKLDEFIGIVGQISANLSKPLEDMAKLLMGAVASVAGGASASK